MDAILITSCPEPDYVAQAESSSGGVRNATEAAAKMQKKAEEQVLEDKVDKLVHSVDPDNATATDDDDNEYQPNN